MAFRSIAVYTNLADARAAVDDLIANGYDTANVSLIARDPEGVYADYVDAPPADPAGDGAGIGALLGGLAGALIGLAAVPIPVIGPAIVAGPIAAALTGGALGAAGGAVTGALVDALVTDYDLEREYAEYYAESVRRGGVMVLAETEPGDTLAETILARHDPVDLERSIEIWRERGWSGWEDEPYPAEQINPERDFYRAP